MANEDPRNSFGLSGFLTTEDENDGEYFKFSQVMGRSSAIPISSAQNTKANIEYDSSFDFTPSPCVLSINTKPHSQRDRRKPSVGHPDGRGDGVSVQSQDKATNHHSTTQLKNSLETSEDNFVFSRDPDKRRTTDEADKVIHKETPKQSSMLAKESSLKRSRKNQVSKNESPPQISRIRSKTELPNDSPIALSRTSDAHSNPCNARVGVRILSQNRSKLNYGKLEEPNHSESFFTSCNKSKTTTIFCALSGVFLFFLACVYILYMQPLDVRASSISEHSDETNDTYIIQFRLRIFNPNIQNLQSKFQDVSVAVGVGFELIMEVDLEDLIDEFVVQNGSTYLSDIIKVEYPLSIFDIHGGYLNSSQDRFVEISGSMYTTYILYTRKVQFEFSAGQLPDTEDGSHNPDDDWGGKFIRANLTIPIISFVHD